MQGQIIHAISGFYDVKSGTEVYRTRARGNFRKHKITPLVGDFCEFEAGYMLKVLPRRNQLIRPPVANIDQAVVITSAVEPDFSSNLLDRFLVYLEATRISGLIYLTKTDLLSPAQFTELEKQVQVYAKIGYPVFMPKVAFADETLTALKATFAGKLTIFTGQTGAGKSTLLNHLAPGLNLATGEISKSLNRGKHTTRQVTLHELNDGFVADTPGFSSLDLMGVTLENLAEQFPELLKASAACQFRGCQHIAEPNCEVKKQVASGEIAHFRYADYLQFHQELAARKPVYGKH